MPLFVFAMVMGVVRGLLAALRRRVRSPRVGCARIARSCTCSMG